MLGFFIFLLVGFAVIVVGALLWMRSS